MSDSQLDRELEAALGVEPSPEFLARVRTRIAAEPGTALWRLATQRWSFEPLVGLAVFGVVLAVVIPGLMRDEAVRKPAGITASGVVGGAVSRRLPTARDVIPAVKTSATRRLTSRAASTNELPLRLSQPLFSDDDRRVFMQFVTAMEEGRLPEDVISRLAEDPRDVTALAIAPLVIEPLPAMARVEQRGEGQW